MSKKYTNYSNMTKEEIPEPMTEPTTEVETPNEVTSVKETATVTTVEGVVADCERLNVRSRPSMNGYVICVVNRGSKLIIDMTAPTAPDWYKVCAENGAEGYCMKKFIKTESV